MLNAHENAHIGQICLPPCHLHRVREKPQQLKHRPEIEITMWNYIIVAWMPSHPIHHIPTHSLTHTHSHKQTGTHAVQCFCPSTYLVLLSNFHKTKWLEAPHTGRAFGSESCCFLIIFRMFSVFGAASAPFVLCIFKKFYARTENYSVFSAKWGGLS